MAPRFVLSDPADLYHLGSGSGIKWVDYDGFVTCGDDCKILHYDITTKTCSQLLELPKDFYPTTIDCIYTTKVNSDVSKNLHQTANVTIDGPGIIVGSDDGRVCFINQSNKALEKIVDAHKGAILCLRWSRDFSSICSSGEDGQVKVWSKSGLLRSTIFSSAKPVYAVCWSPRGDSILFSHYNYLIVKSIMPGSQEIRWRAHDECISDLDWNVSNNLILSCGYDCRYKIFQPTGNFVHSSKINDQPIMSVSWSSNGLCFIYSTGNCISLCDYSGLVLSQARVSPNDSIASSKFNLSSNDFGIILSRGKIVHGYVLMHSTLWRSIEVMQTDRKTLLVKNYESSEEDKLDYTQSIDHFVASHNHLLVMTKNECYIHKLDTVNAPQVVTLKQRCYNIIVCESSNFAMCDTNSNFYIYTYDAKLITSLKLPAYSVSYFSPNSNLICLSSDSLSIPDLANNSKNIIFHYFRGGHPTSDHILRHHLEVTQLSVYKNVSIEDGAKIMAYIDLNNDLFLYKIDPMNQRYKPKPVKLDTNCRSILWNESMKVLAASKNNGTIQLWIYPEAAFKSQSTSNTTIDTLISLSLQPDKIPKRPRSGGASEQLSCTTRIINFSRNYLSIETNGQKNYIITINPMIDILHALYNNNELEKALKVWRKCVNESRSMLDDKETSAIWSMLAYMSIESRNGSLDVAKECFAELGRVDMVEQLSIITDKLTSQNNLSRRADIFLLNGDLKQSCMLLATNNNIEAAIDLNLEFYKYQDAIDLACSSQNELLIKHVLRKRSDYLAEFKMTETDPIFIKLIRDNAMEKRSNSLEDEEETEILKID